MANKTQTERVLEHLQRAPLTQFEAMTSMGIMRLAPRILELRELGHKIVTDTVEVKTAVTGETARVARYTLAPHEHEFVVDGDQLATHRCTICNLITNLPESPAH